ncbi:MAG: hypothetical protein M3018_03675 [Actinomycetota bacterium]|nr:hypothetical protein [Actinomycetota bacterium]
MTEGGLLTAGTPSSEEMGGAGHRADFGDGYRAAELCDAALRSAPSRTPEPVSLRT